QVKAEMVAPADDLATLEMAMIERLILMGAEGARREVVAILRAEEGAVRLIPERYLPARTRLDLPDGRHPVKLLVHPKSAIGGLYQAQPPSWLMLRPTGAMPSSKRCSRGLCFTVSKKRSRRSSSLAPFRSGVRRSTSPSAIRQ